MSTIHDALKKVQNNMHPQENSPDINEEKPEQPKPHNPFNPTPPPTPEAPVQEAEPEPSKGKSKKLLILSLSFLILSGLGFAITYAIDRIDLSTLKEKKFNFLNEKPYRPAAVKKPVDDGQTHVKGTMMLGDKIMVMINNDIYEIGSEFDGKKIKTISQSKVVLVGKNGEEEILKVLK